jgi:predicted DNA-binding protein (MmcQ/YjbR family)
VKGKVFVFFGRRAEPVLRFSVKLPVSGERWLDQEFAEPSAYGMGPHGWVTFSFDTGNVLSERELLPLVEESYRAVAAKALVKELDSRLAGAAAQKIEEKPSKAVQKRGSGKTRKSVVKRARRKGTAQ